MDLRLPKYIFFLVKLGLNFTLLYISGRTLFFLDFLSKSKELKRRVERAIHMIIDR